MVRASTGKDSKQDYATPPDLIAAVQAKFGKIVFDLAASPHNTQHKDYYDESADSLKQDWVELSWKVEQPAGIMSMNLLWLNPPFKHIAPWAAKCAKSGERISPHILIAFLVPASVGADWYVEHVEPHGYAKFLQGRPCFDGSGNGFGKDCALIFFGRGVQPGNSSWNWREDIPADFR